MCSFLLAASSIVGSKDILEKHKKQLLDTIVWKSFEAAWRSNKDAGFIMESVYAAEGMLASPDKIKTILYNAVVCTVTHEEDKRLKDGEDWDRYKAAEIKVYDRLENMFINIT